MKTVSAESLILFNRQLASMVGLDLPLPESLRRAGADMQDPALAKTAALLAEEVERGSSFSQALDKHKDALPEMYGAMVKAGEAGGNLSETLRRAAAYEEQMLMLSNKLQASLVYPAIILTGLAGLLGLFALFVIPRMRILLQQFQNWGGVLPIPTRILLFFGTLLGHWLTYVFLASLAVVAYRRREEVLRWLGERQFRIPFWNDFVTMILMARFCKTLGELLSRGVGMIEAFSLTRKTMGNRVFEEAVAKAAASVERGGKLSEAMAQTGVFPTTATWLLGAAEEKGDLVACLAELGDCYHQAAERRGLLLAQLIEPFTIIVLGLCVGFVVISFFMPLFGLGSLTSQ